MSRIYQAQWANLATAGADSAARLVLAVLMSSAHVERNGVVPYTPSRWAHLAGLTTDEVIDAVEQLDELGFVIADLETDEVWLRDFVRCNDPYGKVRPTAADLRSVVSARIRNGAPGSCRG